MLPNSLFRKATFVFALSFFSFALSPNSLFAIQDNSQATILTGPKIAQDSVQAPIDANQKIDQLITNLVLENIPHSFTDTKKWGMQKERWDGLHVRREGWEIKTKRRKKLVNHGKWQKYTAALINPNEEFAVDVNNMRQLDDGRLGFDVNFVAHLAIDGRHSNWVKGVQLYSVSANGTAKVRLQLSCELKIDLDLSSFPPDVVLTPHVVAAEINVDEFKLDRISKLGGEFAQQVSKATRSILDEKIEEKEDKLVTKINAKLKEEKDRGEMRLSLADAINSKWTSEAIPVLPDNLLDAIDQLKK